MASLDNRSVCIRKVPVSNVDLHTSYSDSESSVFFLIPAGSFLVGKSITKSFQL
jgi:hypothetical protein